MQFIHAREHLNEGDHVVVTSDTQAYVRLMTDSNFENYRRGETYNFFGGFYERFPVRLYAEHTGYWNVTLDVGEGHSANIRYSINVVRKT